MGVNRKKQLITAALLLAAAAFAFYIIYQKSSSFEGYYEARAREVRETCPEYDIRVVFDPALEMITAKQTVVFHNNTAGELREVYFHLYPNAFRSIESAPFPAEELKYAYPEGFSQGYLNVTGVRAGGKKLEYRAEGTVLKVTLPEPLKSGEKIKIEMDFEEKIPFSLGRFGHGKNTYNFGNWYPILCVYDENGWNKDPYYSIGDPFYSETAVYTVSITAPSSYTIAASGRLVEKIREGDRTKWTFRADLVRDFAWMAGSEFKVLSGKVDGVKVSTYYFGSNEAAAKKALEFGKQAIRFFNDYFGPYPYEEYSIVAADFYIGGMEYPNLVLIDWHLFDDETLLEYVVAHETAHQWWYGLVGNNQVKEPWLDEALTEYSTVLYYEGVYGRRRGGEVYQDFIVYPYRFFELGNNSGPILRSLPQFAGWGEYDATVYKKGAIMLKELESRLGKTKLRQVLRLYLRENAYGNATTEDFVKAVNRVMGTDFSNIIYDMLKKSGRLQERDAA
ncbi:M1 family metallopeptidase [Thermosediminibacter oceani]|uniref:Peptidase M1 membrane alanine aminopeptidase n=1 Tax=Thermosediminibacter oceani (strain ATCC BAA-1034 / DSM 16646 / JW/IW-1228P) TaxID=555079 RepID=D9S175_THEOJ|nr:Peptidase M1 membrane alanine aminopeptidase [Thermosediminibacter oceani DSM 16646]